MGRPNYAFAKHQRDLAKKKKKEEKRRLKAEARQAQHPETDSPEEAETGQQEQPESDQ